MEHHLGARPRDVLAGGALAAWLAITCGPVVGFGALVAGAATVLAIDADRRTLRLPNRLVGVVALTTLVTAAATGRVPEAATSALLAAAPLYVVRVLAAGRLGLGDVKLAAATGGFLGVISVGGGLWLALITVTVAGARRARPDEPLPLGPVLGAAALVVAVGLTAVAPRIGIVEHTA